MLERGITFVSSGKTFHLVDISNEGERWFSLSETSRRYRSKININKCNLQWVVEALKQASLQPGNKCRRWCRKVKSYIFRAIQNFNSYVSFIRIEAILGDRKSAIIIPEGSYNRGWGDIAEKIQGFLGDIVDPRFHLLTDESRSYMEAANISQWPSLNDTFNVAGTREKNCKEETELFLSKCLIGSFNDPFHFSPRSEVIQKWFLGRWQITAGLKVTPIRHNQFLFELPSKAEANRVKAGEWFWNGRRLTLEWWSPVTGTGMTTAKSKERWIRAVGIPLHAWTTETFKYIGDKCGGFIGIDEDTKHRVHFFWARICVKYSERDLSRNIDLVCGDWSFDVNITEDTHANVRPAEKSSVAGTLEAPEIAGPSYLRDEPVKHMTSLPNSSFKPVKRMTSLPNNSFNLKSSPLLCTMDNRWKGKATVQEGESGDVNSASNLGPISGKSYYKTYQRRGLKFKKAQNTRPKESRLLNIKTIWRVVQQKHTEHQVTEQVEIMPSISIDQGIPIQQNLNSTKETTEISSSANDEDDNRQRIPRVLSSNEMELTSFDSETDFSTQPTWEALPPTWYEGGPCTQLVDKPTLVETSQWTKITMVKACKAFGVNASGFEHELLDIVFRMEQRRRIQIQPQLEKHKSGAKKKNKGEGGMKRLEWVELKASGTREVLS